MTDAQRAGRTGFSLLELVIVIVVLAIIAAIAVPKLSRASAGASDNALKGNLATLRGALEMFRAEHDGAWPDKDHVQECLCHYSNLIGDSFSAIKDQTHYLGPYLKSPPPLPVGDKKGFTTIANNGAGDVGWVYNEAEGTITANCEADETDAASVPYDQY